MNRIWKKLRETKGAALALALFLCAAAFLLLSVSPGESGDMTDEEARLSRTLSAIAGAGKTRIAVYYAAESGGRSVPCGAVIVSEGAGDIAVRLDLLRAAQTLLRLPAGAVEVFEAEGSE